MVRSCDLYGQPISMNFENKQTHQTIFGGLMSLTFMIGLSVYFLTSMLASDQFYQKDTISTFVKISGFEEPPAAEMCNDGIEN